MNETAPRVLMVGTSLGGRGGVSAVVSVLREDGLFEREAVRYIATHVDGNRFDKARGFLRGLWKAARTCFLDRPAIVHVHAASHASFLRKSFVLLLARLAGSKTIFHLHGGGFRQFATQEAGPVLRRWIRHTLEASSVVITLSKGWAVFVNDFAPRARVEVVPNSVPLPALSPAPFSSPSTSLAVPGEPGRVLFLGRLEAAKGIVELLEAGALLAPRFPGLRLVFGGDGDLAFVRRRAAELGILDRVELLGWVDPQARDAQLERAWVFCLPSHAEGLPMSMLEAMAARRPVVVSAVGGIPETINDGVDGILVPPRDARALAAALARVLDDEALRSRLAHAARASIERNYSTEVVCGKLAAIYNQLAGVR